MTDLPPGFTFRPPLVSHRRPIKASAALAHDIVDYIVREGLEEGARLPTERQMIAETSRARGTLREALRLLESRGVLTIRQGSGGGPIVRRLRPSDLGEALTLLMVFQRLTMADLVDARGEIEVLIAKRCAERISDFAVKELESTMNLQKAVIQDREEFLKQSQRLHQIINDSSGSPVLSLINQALFSVAHAVFIPLDYPVKHREEVIRGHERIVKALRNRSPAEAESAMRRHVVSFGKRWRKEAGAFADRPLRWVPLEHGVY